MDLRNLSSQKLESLLSSVTSEVTKRIETFNQIEHELTEAEDKIETLELGIQDVREKLGELIWLKTTGLGLYRIGQST